FSPAFASKLNVARPLPWMSFGCERSKCVSADSSTRPSSASIHTRSYKELRHFIAPTNPARPNQFPNPSFPSNPPRPSHPHFHSSDPIESGPRPTMHPQSPPVPDLALD